MLVAATRNQKLDKLASTDHFDPPGLTTSDFDGLARVLGEDSTNQTLTTFSLIAIAGLDPCCPIRVAAQHQATCLVPRED